MISAKAGEGRGGGRGGEGQGARGEAGWESWCPLTRRLVEKIVDVDVLHLEAARGEVELALRRELVEEDVALLLLRHRVPLLVWALGGRARLGRVAPALDAAALDDVRLLEHVRVLGARLGHRLRRVRDGLLEPLGVLGRHRRLQLRLRREDRVLSEVVVAYRGGSLRREEGLAVRVELVLVDEVLQRLHL